VWDHPHKTPLSLSDATICAWASYCAWGGAQRLLFLFVCWTVDAGAALLLSVACQTLALMMGGLCRCACRKTGVAGSLGFLLGLSSFWCVKQVSA
jgi:hypothetical protein